MADAVDSKSTGSNTLWVQVSFPGPLLKSLQIVKIFVFNFFLQTNSLFLAIYLVKKQSKLI